MITPEGLTIVIPDHLLGTILGEGKSSITLTPDNIRRLLRGRKTELYREVAKVTTVQVRDDGHSTCQVNWSSTHGVKITIYLSVKQSQSFRWMPWSAALHEWGHAVSDYHYFMTWKRSWLPYLVHRGLVGHPMLDKFYTWTVREMIADDYKIRFGNRHLERTTHMNRDLPALDVVAGRNWFNRAWRGL